MSGNEVPSALRRAVGIHHAAFRCRDAEQTRWFYEDVLGLPLAMCFVEEEVPGLRKKIPFMHLFFELGNNEYVAFFDQPGTATAAQFENADSFDRHIAFEVADEATLTAWQQHINSLGVSCLGPLDHGFVKSVYMYDPNGLQVELTTRTARHDQVMLHERAQSREVLQQWSQRTRDNKEQRFGAAAIDLRSRQKRSTS
jgi:catechol 2,3-dioxygenase-like lactoylglutathione lyase family enzyme